LNSYELRGIISEYYNMSDILRIQKKLEQSGLIPFGPFIVGAALLITVLNSLALIAPLINFSGRF